LLKIRTKKRFTNEPAQETSEKQSNFHHVMFIPALTDFGKRNLEIRTNEKGCDQSKQNSKKTHDDSLKNDIHFVNRKEN